MTTGDRIKKLRTEMGITQDELATYTKTTKQTIHKYEVGIIQNIPASKIKLLADRLSTTPAYLMGWDNSDLPKNMEPYNPVMHRIPILGHIAAGMPIYADEHIEGYTYTEHNGGAEYFALRVNGDSMTAANIPDGSLAIVRRQPAVENGEIAAVRVNNENATIKRFKQDKNIIQLIPQSYNPNHQIQIYDLKKDNIEIVGKIVECKVEFN